MFSRSPDAIADTLLRSVIFEEMSAVLYVHESGTPSLLQRLVNAQ